MTGILQTPNTSLSALPVGTKSGCMKTETTQTAWNFFFWLAEHNKSHIRSILTIHKGTYGKQARSTDQHFFFNWWGRKYSARKMI